MTLLTETSIISAIMVALSAIPLFWARARRHITLLFLLGTGSLLGIFAFDLLPDVFALGGGASLAAVGAVWALYSIAHILHVGRHASASAGGNGGTDRARALETEAVSRTASPGHPHHVHHDPGSALFLASMAAHCFASGMLLVLSSGLDKSLGRAVFLALLAHKGYEALTVSSVLARQESSRSRAIAKVALYAFALPLGAAMTALLQGSLTKTIAILAASMAAGSLLGCLIYDFLLPSWTHVRARYHNLGWILVGLLATQAVMRTF